MIGGIDRGSLTTLGYYSLRAFSSFFRGKDEMGKRGEENSKVGVLRLLDAACLQLRTLLQLNGWQ